MECERSNLATKLAEREIHGTTLATF